MTYTTTQTKKSTFTTDDAITNASLFDFIKAGVNKKTTWQNIIDQIAAVYGLGIRLYETESAMIADTNLSLGDHAIVEENRYRLYEVSNVSAGTGDVTLSNGLTAGQQGNIVNNNVLGYAELRALSISYLVDGEPVSVTNPGIAREGVLRNDVAHGLTDNGGTIIVIDANWWWDGNANDDLVNVRWFGATGDGSTDDTASIQAAVNFVGPINQKLFVPPASVHYSINATIDLGAYTLQIEGNKSLFIWDSLDTDPMFAISAVGGGIEATSINLNGNNVATEGILLGLAAGSAFTSFGGFVRDVFCTKFTAYGIDCGISNPSAAAVDFKFYNYRGKLNDSAVSIPQPSYTFYGGQIDDNTTNGIFVGGNGFYKAFGLIFNNNGTSHIKYANLSRGGACDGCWFEGTPIVDFVLPGATSNNVGNIGFTDCHFKVEIGDEMLDFTKLNTCITSVIGCQISGSTGDATITLGGNKTVVQNLQDESGLLAYAGNVQFLTLIQDADITLARDGALKIRNQAGAAVDALTMDSSDQTVLTSAVTAMLIARGVEAVAIDADNGRGAIVLRNDTSTQLDTSNPTTSGAKLVAQDNGSGKTMLIVRFDDGTQATLATQP